MIIMILGIVIFLLCLHINYLYKVNAIDKKHVSNLKEILDKIQAAQALEKEANKSGT